MAIKVRVNKSKAIDEWMRKEYGSYEDHKESNEHVYAILSDKLGKGEVTLTEKEAQTILKSGDYHKDAYDPEDIVGGVTTMRTISGICDKIRAALNNSK